MDRLHTDSLTRFLADVPSHRSLLRGLTGAGGILGGLWLPDAVGARKRRKKKRKKQHACRTGQRVGAVEVPATGAAVFTPVLKQGQRYRLRASGIWASNLTNGQDAYADFLFADPTTHTKVFQGIRLGLEVGGGSPDGWGSSYTTTHTYEREVTGEGVAFSLRCRDVVYSDNSGRVTVEIFCA